MLDVAKLGGRCVLVALRHSTMAVARGRQLPLRPKWQCGPQQLG